MRVDCTWVAAREHGSKLDFYRSIEMWRMTARGRAVSLDSPILTCTGNQIEFPIKSCCPMSFS